jgi:hypothetical protein
MKALENTIKLTLIMFTFKLTLIMFTLLLPISCQEKDITTKGDVIDYNKIGIEHNKGLDAAFEMLKAMKKEDRGYQGNLSHYFDALEKATINFTLRHHAELSDLSVTELTKNLDHIKNSFHVFNEGLDIAIENKPLHYQMLSDVQHLITLKQNTYLQKNYGDCDLRQ